MAAQAFKYRSMTENSLENNVADLELLQQRYYNTLCNYVLSYKKDDDQLKKNDIMPGLRVIEQRLFLQKKINTVQFQIEKYNDHKSMIDTKLAGMFYSEFFDQVILEHWKKSSDVRYFFTCNPDQKQTLNCFYHLPHQSSLVDMMFKHVGVHSKTYSNDVFELFFLTK
jgi:hypothetical protein